MSYTKQTWQTGDIITAEKLNHIEDGIEGLNGYDIIFTIDDDEVTADGASFEELVGNGYKKALLNDYRNNAFFQSVRYESHDDEDDGEPITVIGFYFCSASDLVDITLKSNGKCLRFFDSGSGTYTYSNGHYVFTLTGGGGVPDLH